MGLLAWFECSTCGYRTEHLALGPAPYPERFDPQLVTCTTCRTVDVVHKPKMGSGCPACGEPLRAENAHDRVACPSCGRPMQRVHAALWD